MPGKVFAVFSASGGRGVTFLASQLALQLSLSGKTCLLDFDLEWGACAAYLNLEGGAPLALTDQQSKGKAGTQIVGAGEKYEKLTVYSRLVLDSHATYSQMALEQCKKEFDYLVIDLPHSLTIPHVVSSLKQADVIVVCDWYPQDENAALFKLKPQLDELGISRNKEFIYALCDRTAVGNKSILKLTHPLFVVAMLTAAAVARLPMLPGSSLILVAAVLVAASVVFFAPVANLLAIKKSKELLAACGLTRVFSIPYDARSVKWAINQGQSVQTSNARSPIAKSIEQLAGALCSLCR